MRQTKTAKKKTVRGIRTGKQVKLSQFADNMVVHLENPRKAIINLTTTTKKGFSEVVSYKIKIQN